MTRPFVLVGFGYLLALTAAVYFGAQIALVLSCLCLCTAAFLLWQKRGGARVFVLATITISLALGNFYVCTQTEVEPVLAADGQDAEITAVLCELPQEQYHRHYYVLEVKEIILENGEEIPQIHKIRLSSQTALPLSPYDSIRGKVHLFLPQGGDGFSSRSYYQSKGIQAFAYLYEYEGYSIIPADHLPPYGYALNIRKTLLQSLSDLLPREQSALASGVLLGEDSGISSSIQEDFREIGISHILSVSGLHMSTIAQLLLMLFLFFRIPRRVAAGFTAGGVFLFMAVTGFVPSVSRSGIMCLIYLLGIILVKKADSLNSLGIAVLVLCVINPYAAADMGFLLSVSATLGLILLTVPITNRLKLFYRNLPFGKRVLNFLSGVVATTISATLFTLPVTILAFGSISLISPLANLLELFPSTLLMGCALFSSLLHLVPGLDFIAMPLALLTGLLGNYMQGVAELLAQIPFASVSTSFGFIALWLAFTLFLLGLVILLFPKRYPVGITVILSLILLLTGIFSSSLSTTNPIRVAVLDTSGGTSVVITKNGRAAVFGCEGFNGNTLVSYLKSQNVMGIDYLQILGNTDQEYQNAAGVLDRFPVAVLASCQESENGKFRSAVEKIENVYYQEEMSACLWECIDVIIENNNTFLEIHGVTFLLTGENEPFSNSPTFARADIVVSGSTPQTLNQLSPVLLFVPQENPELSVGKIPVGICSMEQNGTILMDIDSQGIIRLRRE